MADPGVLERRGGLAAAGGSLAAAHAVRGVRYPESMRPFADDDDAAAWARRAADVPAAWFARSSRLHGVSHTQRVHIHAQRLLRKLRWPEADARLVLTSALWHDIGRVNDGWDSQHGVLSAARVVELGLHGTLAEADAKLVLFAVRLHCLEDDIGRARVAAEADPERSPHILKVLKDADALDRVRLGADPFWEVDSSMLRHDCTPGMIDFAVRLLEATSGGDAAEAAVRRGRVGRD
jgi:hypothetical protein